MPPKKGAKGKKGKKSKKSADSDDPEALKLSEENKVLKNRIQILERALVVKNEEASRANTEFRIMEERIRRFYADIAREKADKHDITSDMTRQFKTMQMSMNKDLGEKEKSIEAIRAQAAKERLEFEQQLHAKDAIITKKDKEIIELKNKLEQLNKDFSTMLRETLDSISAKIDAKTAQIE